MRFFIYFLFILNFSFCLPAETCITHFLPQDLNAEREPTLKKVLLPTRIRAEENGISNERHKVLIGRLETLPKGADQQVWLPEYKDHPDASFEAVQCFTVAETGYELVEQSLNRIRAQKMEPYDQGRVDSVHHQWTHQPQITIIPYSEEGQNAYFTPYGEMTRGPELHFFYYKVQLPSGQVIWRLTARSADIGWHEGGHSALNVINSNLLYTSKAQPLAIHESFGDLKSVFALLNISSICDEIILNTREDLHKGNFLNKLAEQFGNDLGRENGLRYAGADLAMPFSEKDMTENFDYSLPRTELEPHSLSRVFTGAVYDTLVDAFEELAAKGMSNASFELQSVAQYLWDIYIESTIRTNHIQDLSFAELASTMYMVQENNKREGKNIIKSLNWGDYMMKHFGRRGIDVQYLLREPRPFKRLADVPSDGLHCKSLENVIKYNSAAKKIQDFFKKIVAKKKAAKK